MTNKTTFGKLKVGQTFVFGRKTLVKTECFENPSDKEANNSVNALGTFWIENEVKEYETFMHKNNLLIKLPEFGNIYTGYGANVADAIGGEFVSDDAIVVYF